MAGGKEVTPAVQNEFLFFLFSDLLYMETQCRISFLDLLNIFTIVRANIPVSVLKYLLLGLFFWSVAHFPEKSPPFSLITKDEKR